MFLNKWLAPFGTDFAAGPADVDPKIGDRQLLHGIQDEMHDMTGGHPFDSAHGPDHSRRSYGKNIGVWRSKSILLASRMLAYW